MGKDLLGLACDALVILYVCELDSLKFHTLFEVYVEVDYFNTSPRRH